MNHPSATADTVQQAAIDWAVICADGNLSATQAADFKSWLAQHPSHPGAYDDACQVLQLMTTAAKQAAPSPATVTNRHTVVKPRISSPALALAACLMLAMLLGVGLMPERYQALTADYHTERGETLALTLADGSEVVLGPDSAMDVMLSAQQRRVELLHGVAWFHPAPAKDGQRPPFEVVADDTVTRALGTRFEVERLPAQLLVTVTEHQVAIASHGEQAPLVLNAGQAVRIHPDGLRTPVPAAQTTLADWRQGTLRFQQEPLSHVLARLQRYYPGQLILLGDAKGQRPISGVFDLAQPEQALATITDSLGLTQQSLTPWLTLVY